MIKKGGDMRRRCVTVLAAFLTSVLLTEFFLPAAAGHLPGVIGTETVFATTTGEKLQDAQNEKRQAENDLEKANKHIDNLQQERASLQTYLDNLNQELEKASNRLFEIEQIISEKKEAIEQAQTQIAEAKELQVTRYEEMKERIQYMYERGNESYLDILFASTSFADFLNKADYIEMINAYDRKMLEEYAKTEKEITKKEKELQEDKQTLELLQQEASEDTSLVYQSVKEASENVNRFREEIARKEEEALAYELEIASKDVDIAALKEQYKEELALSAQSAAMGSRDLSELTFSAEDLDLMAAIIECEAGGESYTGKVAVGAVVLNRVRSPLFPSTVLEVIMQKKQFSPVGSGRFAIVLARGANESCYQAAQDAMSGASPVGNCLFFRTPIPGLTGQQIGGHIFY